jgi:hypothetical protein
MLLGPVLPAVGVSDELVMFHVMGSARAEPTTPKIKNNPARSRIGFSREKDEATLTK